MSRQLTPEFALLAACCQWPLTNRALTTVAARAADVDWARVARLTERHRVAGLVWRALQAAAIAPPSAIATRLAASARTITHQNLRIAAESVRLHRSFVDDGIPPLFVKGITLGMLAYGDIARKAGWDIDLLIAPDQLERAAQTLREHGYLLDPTVAGQCDVPLAEWHAQSKESVWRNAAGTIWVELHTALVDNALMLPGVGMFSPRQNVPISPGVTLPTLQKQELFAYLCVHGASSAWFRLKWLADIAALLGELTPSDIETYYHRAVALGAGRAAGQALLLSNRLFATPVPDRLLDDLRGQRQTRWLYALALRKLTARTSESELEDVPLGTLTIHLTQLALLPGWRFKRAELARQVLSVTFRARRPLLNGFDRLTRLWRTPAARG